MTLGLAALVLATQVSAFMHLAFVPHVTCAEHGELVEPGGHEGLAARHHVAPASQSVLADEGEAAAVSGHAHDHCIVTAAQRTPARLVRAPDSIDVHPSGDAESGIRRVRSTPPSLALLAVAPKCSPPAA